MQETKIIVHVLQQYCSCILKILKIGPTALFTHLKIILLQCFQFSIFSFSNNKFNPNGPYILGREAPHATPCLGFDQLSNKNLLSNLCGYFVTATALPSTCCCRRSTTTFQNQILMISLLKDLIWELVSLFLTCKFIFVIFQ